MDPANNTRVDRYRRFLLNNRYLAPVVFVGISIVDLAQFFQSASDVFSGAYHQAKNLLLPVRGRMFWSFGPATASCSMPVSLPHSFGPAIVTADMLTDIAEGRAPPTFMDELLQVDAQYFDVKMINALKASSIFSMAFEAQVFDRAQPGDDRICWFSAFGKRHSGYRVTIVGVNSEFGRPCVTAIVRNEAIAGVPAAPERQIKTCKEHDGMWAHR